MDELLAELCSDEVHGNDEIRNQQLSCMADYFFEVGEFEYRDCCMWMVENNIRPKVRKSEFSLQCYVSHFLMGQFESYDFDIPNDVYAFLPSKSSFNAYFPSLIVAWQSLLTAWKEVRRGKLDENIHGSGCNHR